MLRFEDVLDLAQPPDMDLGIRSHGIKANLTSTYGPSMNAF